MEIGRRIYYHLENGNVILDTGERQGSVLPMTVEHEIASYKALSERNRETFDVLELSFGSYATDFRETKLIGINPETKVPIFEIPNPENPEEPIVLDKPMSVQLEDVRLEMARGNSELFETMIMLTGGGF